MGTQGARGRDGLISRVIGYAQGKQGSGSVARHSGWFGAGSRRGRHADEGSLGCRDVALRATVAVDVPAWRSSRAIHLSAMLQSGDG
jgi:hypothetical protein